MANQTQSLSGHSRLMVWCGAVLAVMMMSSSHARELAFEPAPASDEKWAIEPLQETDNQAYFQAFRSSQAMLLRTLGWGWPTPRLTPEGNLDTIRFYLQQHESQRGYTYVIRDAAHRRIRGAVFINPVQQRAGVNGFRAADYQAEVTFWLNQAGQESGDADALVPQLLTWLRDDWGLERVLFPSASSNQFARGQFEQSRLEFVAENANNDEILHRYRAR
ncbi:GNAT family N-acetyltransferase [Aliidiomarina maris]|uniref:Acetyltransferase (GNAT) family protein n=1 Tax=Aliidiomarina maris TaxID=531312 RepID=A0A327WRX9_9GAMM|nr:GNAT family N-acetyltransferase [Aliidiomarina maris]RAJ95378.1 acetyltransferase (GNAT) family protein [Aliidiomarina maris]RUO22730.1 hypothetical protein CWE07_10725 [Aliidiomarina maris]